MSWVGGGGRDAETKKRTAAIATFGDSLLALIRERDTKLEQPVEIQQMGPHVLPEQILPFVSFAEKCF